MRKKRSRQLNAGMDNTKRVSFKALFRGCAVSIGPPPPFKTEQKVTGLEKIDTQNHNLTIVIFTLIGPYGKLKQLTVL